MAAVQQHLIKEMILIAIDYLNRFLKKNLSANFLLQPL